MATELAVDIYRGTSRPRALLGAMAPGSRFTKPALATLEGTAPMKILRFVPVAQSHYGEFQAATRRWALTSSTSHCGGTARLRRTDSQ